jgi:hypothetical protein
MLLSLESLVLRGVSVLRDGQAVEARLGTSAEGQRTTPTVPVSMRPPQAYPAGFMPAVRPDHVTQHDVDVTVPGAGRPLGLVGVSSRNPARNAGRINRWRWSEPVGGPKSAADSCLGLVRARTETTVREANSERPDKLTIMALPGAARRARRCSAVTVAWIKQATGTPPGSTRGSGVW